MVTDQAHARAIAEASIWAQVYAAAFVEFHRQRAGMSSADIRRFASKEAAAAVDLYRDSGYG